MSPGTSERVVSVPAPAGAGGVETGRRPVEDTRHDRSQALQAARPRAHAPDRRALHRRPPPRGRGRRRAAWELRGGVDGETAAFANVLANLGVAARRRAAVGGDGARRRRRARRGLHPVGVRVARLPARCTLGFRRQWQYPARWARGTAERLGLHAELHETGGAKGAAAALDAQLDRGLPAIAWIDPYQLGTARPCRESRDGYGGPPVVVYERAGDALRDRRPLVGARDGLAPSALAAARGARRLLQAPADHDRPRARRPRRRPPARGRRGGAAAAGRAPEREVRLVLAAGLAQVGADDHRHAQREGLADGVRRRPRDREACAPRSTPAPPAARTCAGSTPTSSTRRPTCWRARRCATPRPRWREAAAALGHDRRHRAAARRRAARADRRAATHAAPLGAAGRARRGRGRAPAARRAGARRCTRPRPPRSPALKRA